MATSFTLPADHPVFAGHFPAHPIVPGALLLDEVVRLASAQAGRTQWMLRTAKFVHPAGPGRTLTVHLDTTDSGALDFRITDGDTLIAAGTLQAA